MIYTTHRGRETGPSDRKDKTMESIYETVKTINGYDIKRMKGTRGFYHVNVRETAAGWKEFHTFRTIKAAAAFIESALPPR